MNSMFKNTSLWLLIAVYAFVMAPTASLAQNAFEKFQDKGGLDSGLGNLLGDPIQEPDQKVTFRSEFTVDEGGKTGTLRVIADVIPNWHIFSVTQPKGGPIKTSIQFQSDFDKAEITGAFEPDSDFHIVKEEGFKVPCEEHEGTVTWSAPISFAEGVDPQEILLPVRIDAQVCRNGPGGQCIPVNGKLQAAFVEDLGGFEYEIQPDGSHATLRGWVTPLRAQPGEKITLHLQLEPESGWHVGDISEKAEPNVISTLVVLTKKNDAEILKWNASSEPTTIGEGDQAKKVYNESVTWEIPIRLPRKIEQGPKTFGGWVAFQTSNGEIDDIPAAVEFTFDVKIGTVTVDAKTNLVFSQSENTDYAKVAEKSQREFESKQKNAGQFAGLPIPLILLFAFIAGMILNIMPCVLPVIGLKILSFIQQAGENPGRVLMLNLAFAGGMLAVFLILATLAVFFGIGWGGLFESSTFTIVMVAVIFAFGLSFFGVWEIPIPGFAVSSGATKMADREGYGGAFTKGILTTLLATPCSGPLLIPAVTWATAQPPVLTYMVFAALGLGMASPYIVIGIRPSLVSFLPKPGAWMETFKQLMGFVMMGTAVFFFNPVPDKLEIPVLVLLLFVGVACWVAGRISLTSTLSVRIRSWSTAVGIVLVGVYVSFFVLIPQHELDWKPYSRQLLSDTLKDGKTVFVDFTADW